MKSSTNGLKMGSFGLTVLSLLTILLLVFFAPVKAVQVTGVTLSADNAGNSTQATISDDGQTIIFGAQATTKLAGITTDQACKSVQPFSSISVATTGASSQCTNPCASGNGSYVVFETQGHLIGTDTDVHTDIYRCNISSGSNERISVNSNGSQSTSNAGTLSYKAINARVDDSGNYVTFISNLDLGSGGSTSSYYVYVRDTAGNTKRVSTDLVTTSTYAAISPDAAYIAFFVGTTLKVFPYDKSSHTIGNAISFSNVLNTMIPSLSGVAYDGKHYVSFVDNSNHTLVYQLENSSTVKWNSSSVTNAALATNTVLSSVGRFIAYQSGVRFVLQRLDGIIWNGTNWITGTQLFSFTELVSNVGTASILPSLSQNGRYAAFQSAVAIAGNTGTNTDIFTVDSALFQPDMQIANSSDSVYIGDNKYYPTPDTDLALQTKSQSITTPITATYYLKVQNDSPFTDSFHIKGTGSGSGWSISYYDAKTVGNDITSLVTSTSGWPTSPLNEGQYLEIRVEVTGSKSCRVDSTLNLLITAQSDQSGSAATSDTVKASTIWSNSAPGANNVNGYTVTSTPATVLTVNCANGLLSNNYVTDVDGDALTVSKVSDPSHGSLTLNSDGSFTYTPIQYYDGTDSFTYKAYDGLLYSDTKTVNITVNAPPNNLTQPANQTVSNGQIATFTVAAAGTATLHYQWQKSSDGATWNNVGNDSNTYATPKNSGTDNGTLFRVIVTNTYGNATSNTAMLTVVMLPSISDTGQPTNQTVAKGSQATFSVTADSGRGTLHYQWQTSTDGTTWNPVGPDSSTYTTPATGASDNGTLYRVAVSNIAGIVTSNTATLTVVVLPSISDTGQPTNQTVIVQQSAKFSVSATTGNGTLSYQWQKNSVDIPGATDATYTTPATSADDNGSTYNVVVTNLKGSVTSNPATLTVVTLPSVAKAPASTKVNVGQTANFTVTANAGNGTLTFQWRKDGTDITGATGTTYTTPITTASDNGAAYDVVVTNAAGSVTSTPAATLTVNSLPTLAAISNQNTDMNVTLANVPLTVGDLEDVTAVQLSWTAKNDPNGIVDTITFDGGTGASRNMTVVPATNKVGTATITVTAKDGDNATVSRDFTLTVYQTYSVTATTAPAAGGTIKPSATNVRLNGYVDFTATPNANYGVNTWTVDGVVKQTGGTFFELSGITQDHVVLVNFKQNYPAPTVTAINGATNVSHENSGQLVVTNLAGTGFRTGATVQLTQAKSTSISASSIVVVSDTEITCTFNFNLNTLGDWSLKVTNDDAKSATLANAVTLVKSIPHINSLAPNSGVTNATVTNITLYGLGFASDVTAKLTRSGYTDVPFTAVKFGDTTRFTGTLNLTGVAPGPWTVVVTNKAYATSSPETTVIFTVANLPAPTLKSISPASVKQVLNTTTTATFTLTGTNFRTPTVVLHPTGATTNTGDLAVTVTTSSSTTVAGTLNVTNVATGKYDIVLTDGDGQSVILANAYTISPPGLTAVSLTTDRPSGQPAGASIKLTATKTGTATAVQYAFFAKCYNTATQLWEVTQLSNYSTTTTCTWKPMLSQNYWLYVKARETGSTADYQVISDDLFYNIVDGTLLTVAFSPAPPKTDTVNTAINLKAVTTGTAQNVEFSFVGWKYNTTTTNWDYFDIRGYQAVNTCAWTPDSSGQYMICILGRLVGSTAAYQVSSKVYTVTVN